MKKVASVIALALLAACATSAPPVDPAQKANTSFFITSANPGSGGGLG